AGLDGDAHLVAKVGDWLAAGRRGEPGSYGVHATQRRLQRSRLAGSHPLDAGHRLLARGTGYGRGNRARAAHRAPAGEEAKLAIEMANQWRRGPRLQANAPAAPAGQVLDRLPGECLADPLSLRLRGDGQRAEPA